MQRRHAFITGASSGLGKELARQLAGKAYNLTLIARRKKLLNDLKKELKDSGSKIHVVQADVSSWEAMQKAVASAVESIGPIDVLVANAGISYPTRATKFDVGKAKEILDTNVLGLMHTVTAALPGFIERKSGHIVGISSLSSYIGLPGYSAYSASKAAVSNYLDAIRVELVEHKLTVTKVCPGFIRTPMTDKPGAKLPFIMDVEPAAQLIVRGIEKRDEQINFPEPVFRAIQALNILPHPLYKRIMSSKALHA